MHTYLCWDWVRFYDQNNLAPGSEQMGPGPWRTMGGSVDSWSPSHPPLRHVQNADHQRCDGPAVRA